MSKRLFHRWFAVLGLVAMLGALVAVPLSTSSALAMAGPPAATADAGGMPCHKPAKPCPNCPLKGCLDLGGCLVKCFQQVPPPLGVGSLQGMHRSLPLPPAAAQMVTGSLIPPLLRPPSV